MVRTADDPSTEFPLSSLNWLPVHDVVGSLCRLTANRRLADRDLTTELAQRVHSMRRCFVHGRKRDGTRSLFGPDPEWLAFSFWADHVLDSWSDRTFVRCSHRGRDCDNEYFIFYVWKPDLAKIWPTVFGSSSSLPPSSPPQEPPQQPQPKGPQPAEVAPTVPKPEKPQPEDPKPPPAPTKAKAWVPYAIKQWPQEKDEDQSDYVDRLLRHAPKSWTRHTIQNLLSIEKKQHN